MISIFEAKELINTNTTTRSSESIEVINSLGKILAKDLYAPIDLPTVNRSAMDGFAVANINDDGIYRIIGEVQAGDDASEIKLKENEAIKIFTGAMCPADSLLVCRIEDVNEDRSSGIIKIEVFPEKSANIRLKGEQMHIGDKVLQKGHLINVATVGLLANLGLTEVDVFSYPLISILSTGNELKTPGEPLKPGELYESNALMLRGALEQYGFKNESIEKIKDDFDSTVHALKKALDKNDVIIVSGGVSVGDYDFVVGALNTLGVKQIFHKVNQKPGKPMYFGVKSDKLIFALPGNPAAVLTCFYNYVLPSLKKQIGKGFTGLKKKRVEALSSIQKPNSRPQFLKATVTAQGVTHLFGQSSAMLHSYSLSNALIFLDEYETFEVGDEVEVLLLD